MTLKNTSQILNPNTLSDKKMLQETIENAYRNRDNLTPQSVDSALKEALHNVLLGLESGELRVAEQIQGKWHVHTWLKQAILLYFKTHDSQVIEGGFSQFYDKVPLRFNANSNPHEESKNTFSELQTRIVPPSTVRRGAYIGPRTVLMPSFINIGAYVGSGTMVDTWATVGSCAQIGNNVHLSGGVGIGGVLEPLQASPTIIEDDCFIGARSEVVEGVIIEKGSVISMGVFLGQSTRIYHRETGEITYGRIPKGSVVVSGSLPSPDGKYQLYCAVIVKQVDEKTRSKTSINELLRF